MKRIVRLTESDLTRLVKRVINEERKNQKEWKEFKKWLEKTGQVEIYYSGGEERFKPSGKLPRLYFNDGFNMSLQIYEHNEGHTTFNAMSLSEDEPLLDRFHEYGEGKKAHYGRITGGAIARIVEKHDGIDEKRSLSGDKVEPGEAPNLSESHLIKKIKRVTRNNFY